MVHSLRFQIQTTEYNQFPVYITLNLQVPLPFFSLLVFCCYCCLFAFKNIHIFEKRLISSVDTETVWIWPVVNVCYCQTHTSFPCIVPKLLLSSKSSGRLWRTFLGRLLHGWYWFSPLRKQARQGSLWRNAAAVNHRGGRMGCFLIKVSSISL